MRPHSAPAPALEVPFVALPGPLNELAALAIAAIVALFITTALLTLSPPAERAAATVMGRWHARRRPRM